MRAWFEARGGIFGGPGFFQGSHKFLGTNFCKLLQLLLSIHGEKAEKIKIFLLIVHPSLEEPYPYSRGSLDFWECCSAGTSPAPLSILRISKTPHLPREWDRKVTSLVLTHFEPQEFIAFPPQALGNPRGLGSGEEGWAQRVWVPRFG